MEQATIGRAKALAAAMAANAAALVAAWAVDRFALPGSLAGVGRTAVVVGLWAVVVAGLLGGPLAGAVAPIAGFGTRGRTILRAAFFGYVGCGIVQALVSFRELLREPSDIADIAFLNVVFKAIEVGAQWPVRLAGFLSSLL